MFDCIYFSLTDLSIIDAYWKKLYSHNILISKKGYKPLIIAYFSCGVGIYGCRNGKILLLLKYPSKNRMTKRFLLFKFLLLILLKRNFKFIYFRYPRPDFLFFISLIFVKFRVCKIFYEIPTYPFSKEFPPLLTLHGLFERLNCYAFLPLSLPFINHILVIAYKGKIIFRPTIKIENGVTIAPNVNYRKKNSEYLKLISVVNFSDSNNRHGLDRILQGLSKHDHSLKAVKLFIVGAGHNASLQEAIKLGKEKGYVKLLGYKTSIELQDIYNEMDIGVGNLAFHRITVDYTSSLKEREFSGSGLPYISASLDYLIPDNINIRLKIPNDDDPVDIIKVLSFFEEFSKNSDPHKYVVFNAKNHLSWDIAMNNFLRLI